MAENNHDERSVMIYFLAGVGVGALIGAAAGILLAPRSGAETREELARKFDELKNRVTDWMRERRERKTAGVHTADEAGA